MPKYVSHWRQIARETIKGVIDCTPADDPKVLRRAISAAYPFGPREMHPYKIWLDEVARQLGTKKHKPKDHSGRIIIISKDQDKLL
jgi:hypothetical protein